MTGTLLEAIDRIRKIEGQIMADSGKRYTGVSARIEALRLVTGDEYGIETTMLAYPGWAGDNNGNNQTIVMQAIIRDRTGRVVSTGHAEETRGSTWINETSALENCETSAIGRALAALGIHGGEFASTNEIDIATRKRAQTSTSATTAASNGKLMNIPPIAASSTTIMPVARTATTTREATSVVAGLEIDGSWSTAVETFRLFAIECGDIDKLQDFWDRNRMEVDRMKAEAPLAFKEVKDIFASRERWLKTNKAPF